MSEEREDPTEVLTQHDDADDAATTHGVADQQPSSPVTRRNMFQHAEAHPLVLGRYLLQVFGPHWLLWETETLLARLRELGHHTVSHTNLDKIQAVKALQVDDATWSRWEVFNHIVHALTGEQPDFFVMQIPSVAQCAVGVDIIEKIRDDVTWEEEVRTFVGEVCRHEQILCPQAPIQWAILQVAPDILDAKKVTYGFHQARLAGHAPVEQTIEAEQIRRLIVVDGLVRSSQRQHDAQLELLVEA